MPKLGHFRKKKVYLPSFDDPEDKAWVEVALDFPMEWVFEVKDDAKGMTTLSKIIVAWNLTGDDGKEVEINAGTVKKINHTDQKAILKAAGLNEVVEASKLDKQEKKV